MSTEQTYSRAEVLDLCQKQKDQCQQMLTAAGQIEGTYHNVTALSECEFTIVM